MDRRARRVSVSGVLHFGLALALAGAPARAQLSARARPFAIPLGQEPLALGAGYDSQAAAARGEPGACVEDVGTEQREGDGPRWSIAVLSRAGGRLVVGVHVSAPTAIESLASPRLTDAVRRLADKDAPAFRELCGDGFVGARTLGSQWLGEVEVERADVSRAIASLTTGTWSDPEPFRAALETLVKRHRVVTRELPNGKRAEAREVAPEELVTRAVEFPANAASGPARPYLATFTPYSAAALSGVLLPDPEALDERDVAEQVFRGGRSGPQSSAAQRAADMRAAQVHRESAPAADDSSQEPIVLVAPVREAPPAAPDREAALATAATAPSVATAVPALQRQPALVYEPGGLVVFATPRAPGGVYVERVGERFDWVPGAAAGSDPIRAAIAKARTGPPVRGTTIAVATVGATTVVMTDAPPIADVHAEPAGERRAWIAGVAAPDPAQRAALASAIRADAASD